MQALLYSKHFATPGLHTIVLTMPKLSSQASLSGFVRVDKFVLEVVIPDSSPGPTSPSMSSKMSNILPTSLPPQPPTSSKQGKNVQAIVGGVIGGFSVILCILTVWLWYRRKLQRMQPSNGRDALQPFPLSEPHMVQTGSPQELPVPRRIVTTVITGGKRIVRNVFPETRDREARSRNRYEIDAGPVDAEGGSDVGETMPPQYEQVFRSPAGNQEGNSTGDTGARRTRKST